MTLGGSNLMLVYFAINVPDRVRADSGPTYVTETNVFFILSEWSEADIWHTCTVICPSTFMGHYDSRVIFPQGFCTICLGITLLPFTVHNKL